VIQREGAAVKKRSLNFSFFLSFYFDNNNTFTTVSGCKFTCSISLVKEKGGLMSADDQRCREVK
jgi:hypothetical protein